jgi:hypothetical protein
MDDFFASYYRNRPVSATFIGVHEFDHALPDFSYEGITHTVAEMEDLLVRLTNLPSDPLEPIQLIDKKLAEGFLRVQLWEYQKDHFQHGNPSLYTGEAIFGLFSLLLTEYAPLAERIEAMQARLESIPILLAQGQKNITAAPPAWTERAIRECKGGLVFLAEGIETLLRDQNLETQGLHIAAQAATAAIHEYQLHLEQVVLQNPVEKYGCGAEAFDQVLRWSHFSTMDAAEIAFYAAEQLKQADANLQAHAADFGAASTDEALAKLAALHPNASNYYHRYTELWHACQKTVIENELVSMPDFPIEYIPRPNWSRNAATYLYFLFYRSPAAFNRPAVHKYLVMPLDESLSTEEQEQFLRSNNDSVIKLNHVVHHGCVGHHVQNWNAYHCTSRIGQIAAVDCSARIAMLCGGTMAEGWACYATELMAEAGFLTPLEEYAEYQSRRRMCARAIVDNGLHEGKMTFDEAVRFFHERGGMSPAAAKAETVKTSMFPGSASMYIIGQDGIHTLRKDMEAALGSRFNLRAFHDELLAYGSIPVPLISVDMKRKIKDAE